MVTGNPTSMLAPQNGSKVSCHEQPKPQPQIPFAASHGS